MDGTELWSALCEQNILGDAEEEPLPLLLVGAELLMACDPAF
jgi:hypothetical protein